MLATLPRRKYRELSGVVHSRHCRQSSSRSQNQLSKNSAYNSLNWRRPGRMIATKLRVCPCRRVIGGDVEHSSSHLGQVIYQGSEALGIGVPGGAGSCTPWRFLPNVWVAMIDLLTRNESKCTQIHAAITKFSLFLSHCNLLLERVLIRPRLNQSVQLLRSVSFQIQAATGSADRSA